MTDPKPYIESTDVRAPGRAWRVNLDEMIRYIPGPSSAIGMWIINAPWAHPLWHSYVMALIHLRHVDGLGPPSIYLQGATHELFLYALSIGQPLAPVIEGKAIPIHLEPANYAGQWIAGSDAEAIDKVELAIEEIMRGALSPDTDFRHQWIARFGDSNLRR